MGPWQESKKYSLQAYLCSFVKKSVKKAEINVQLIFPIPPYFEVKETHKYPHTGQGAILLRAA